MLSRAGLSSLKAAPPTNGQKNATEGSSLLSGGISHKTGPASVDNAASMSSASASRVVKEIATRNYTSRYCEDSDDEDDAAGEGYLIDPSIQLFKSIDFGRNRPKQDIKESSKPDERKSIKSRPNEKPSSGRVGVELNPALLSSGPTVLGDGSSKLNQAHSSDPASAEIEDLKRSLDRLAREKIDAENRRRISEKTSLDLQESVAEQMRRQQEELRAMMESIQREREQITLTTRLAEAEKIKAKQEQDRQAQYERNELRQELEVMKMQNAMLVNRIHETQSESRELLAKERAERISAVQSMESENRRLTQQLMQAQSEAEMDLAREKDELRLALKRMEQEKTDLRNR